MTSTGEETGFTATFTGRFSRESTRSGDLRRHGGGEKQRLLPFGQPAQDLADIVDEAHVQHPVRLIQDQDLQMRELHKLLLIQIHQPPGRGHQNVGPPFQGCRLGGLAHAAEDHGAAQGQMAGVALDVLLNLESQLAGWGQESGPEWDWP